MFTDENGKIPKYNHDGFGLYTRDTRFLSRMEWSLGDISLRLLSAEANGAEILFRYTNREKKLAGGKVLGDTLEVVCER